MAKKKGKKKYIVLLIALVIILAVAYVYFFIISPTFVVKPVITKTALGEDIGASNVNWMVNELGAYKLHSDPLSGEPAVMEIEITDTGEKFAVTIDGNVPSTEESAAASPDIRIKVGSADFTELYKSEDIVTKAVAMQKQGKVQIELLKGMVELAAKGYKAIYDELQV
ncbi:MAG: hypothetical protein ACE5J7_02720 [Candidatus Aenigmatarchaeota archaeon]